MPAAVRNPASTASARGVEIDVLEYVDRENSWGIFYEGFTGGLGFRPHNDEGKVMGLAAYGDPQEGIFPCVDLSGDGGWPSYDLERFNQEVARIRPRGRDDYPINGYHEHIAARAQLSLEAAVARAAEELHRAHRPDRSLPRRRHRPQLLLQRQAPRPPVRRAPVRAAGSVGLRHGARSRRSRLREAHGPTPDDRVRPRLLGPRVLE